ncbi:hypothetical protein BC834DRAFT_873712 [Gloeopeniophorella convolvens]|nr:hypothetical protein BC834DRAFT_873712 [Gloeopeniophorella convolvens]
MSTPDEKLRSLREELQRARAERDAQRSLYEADIAAARQSRDDTAHERHEDMMSQLRSMRELLSTQRESQAHQREQLEQRHAEEERRHEDTLRKVSDIQAAVSSLRDDQRADFERHAEEHARAKAEFEEAVKVVTEDTAQTREHLHSLADEFQEDSARRHEELRHVLLASASARESVSFSEST